MVSQPQPGYRKISISIPTEMAKYIRDRAFDECKQPRDIVVDALTAYKNNREELARARAEDRIIPYI